MVEGRGGQWRPTWGGAGTGQSARACMVLAQVLPGAQPDAAGAAVGPEAEVVASPARAVQLQRRHAQAGAWASAVDVRPPSERFCRPFVLSNFDQKCWISVLAHSLNTKNRIVIIIE